MQTREDNEQQPAATPDPQSQPLNTIPVTQVEDEDDPEVIFAKAVAEIDTQPLIQKKRVAVSLSTGDLLEILFDVSLLLCILFGSIYLAITYPHTLIILYAKATPATITATLDVPTRAVAPVTITRSATRATTGTAHQDARAATGLLTFYNGLSNEQTIPARTVLTGRDGVQIVTTQDAVLPAADTTTTPPTDGYVTVPARAINPGVKGNIVAFDVSVVFSSSITVKNLAAFTNGQDERTFQAVAQADLDTLTSTVNATLTQAFTTAFPLQKGEEALPTNCHITTSGNHQIGEEAQIVTLTIAKTCAAVAYNLSQLTRAATAAFTRTRPGTSYHIVSNVQTTPQSVSPLTVALSGKWAYSFTANYEQLLAQEIEEKTPAQAQKILLHTGVISYASIPNKLPPAMYINFFVFIA